QRPSSDRPGAGEMMTRPHPTVEAEAAPMAKSEKPAKPAKAKKQSRRSQVAASYRMTKQADPRIGLILLLTFVVAGGIAALLTWLLLGGWLFPLLNGILIGLLAALIIFGRRAQASAYKQIEGQPGA